MIRKSQEKLGKRRSTKRRNAVRGRKCWLPLRTKESSKRRKPAEVNNLLASCFLLLADNNVSHDDTITELPGHNDHTALLAPALGPRQPRTNIRADVIVETAAGFKPVRIYDDDSAR